MVSSFFPLNLWSNRQLTTLSVASSLSVHIVHGRFSLRFLAIIRICQATRTHGSALHQPISHSFVHLPPLATLSDLRTSIITGCHGWLEGSFYKGGFEWSEDVTQPAAGILRLRPVMKASPVSDHESPPA